MMVKKTHKLFFVTLILVLTLLPVVKSDEAPELPLSLYGRINIFNNPATTGTFIEVRDAGENVCGFTTVSTPGRFGLLNCFSYNTTGNNTGAEPGESLRITVDGMPASVLLEDTADSLGNVEWESGVFKEVIIIRPPLVCGDGFCDNYENCETCPEDCGICPPEEGTGEGETTPDDAPLDGFIPGFPDVGIPPILEEEEVCLESWSCSDWGDCLPGDFQVRECIDLNECGTEEEMPETRRFCEYIEEEEDPRVEDPVDTPPRVEEPLPITICPDKLRFFGFPSVFFITLISLLILSKLTFYKLAIRRYERDEELDEVDILKKKYVHKRRTTAFITTTLSLATGVYAYHYLFFLCADLYVEHLWLLAIFLLLSPLLIYFILSLFKFNDKHYKKTLALFENTFYRHVLKLLKILNKELIISENEISASLKELEAKTEFKQFMQDNSSFKKLYDDINTLYYKYKNDKPAQNTEKDLLENINNLLENKEFEAKTKDDASLLKLKNNLSSLYKAYEYKQELYEELIKLEEEYDEEHGKKPVEEKKTSGGGDSNNG